MVTVRVKVKATGIIRTITRANYELTRSKYELLDAEESAPKPNPQVKKEAVAPVEKEEQPEELIIETVHEPSPEQPTEEKPKRGRKPKQA